MNKIIFYHRLRSRRGQILTMYRGGDKGIQYTQFSTNSIQFNS